MSQRITSISARFFKAAGLPLRREAVFFVLMMVMWGPYTWIVLTDCLRLWSWQWPFYNRLIYFASYTFLWSYLTTTIVSVTRWRWFKIALYAVSVLNWGVFLFLKFNFHTMLTPDVLQAILETNPNETANFWQQYALTRVSVLAYVGVAAMVAVIVAGEHWWQGRCSGNGSVWLGSLVVLCLAGSVWCLRPFAAMLRCDTIDQLESCEIYGTDLWGGDNLTTYIYSIHTLRVSMGEIDEAIARTTDEGLNGDATRTGSDSLTVILVIGESYIKSHCALYGYPLNTTPNLIQARDTGRLWVFDDVISPYNYTSTSLKNALFCNSIGHSERWSQTPSLFAVMHRAGFDVYMWDNQLNYFKGALFSFALNGLLYNDTMRNICYTAVSDSCFDYDEQLVNDYLSSSWHSKPSAGKMVTFHLMGQHFNSAQRYPHGGEWDHFTADSVTAKHPWLTQEKRAEIAEYDNATRYNDHVMGKIFDAYRDQNAVVIYFADHGEEVYDWRDFSTRDESSNKLPQAIVYQNSVPMMVWCSDRYVALHPDVPARLERGRHHRFMHDNLCQIIFDLAGIDTRWYHAERDPLSEQFKPSKRIVYDRIDYDKMQNK